MKEFIKNISYIILIVLSLMVTITASYNYGKINGYKKSLEIIQQNTTQETFTHTLENVVFDTVFLDKYIPYYEIDTVLLKDTIILKDTLIVKDVVYLPNQISKKDTVFTDTINNQIINNELYIKLSGYQTSIDSLCLTTTIKQHATRKKWYERLTPAIGVGVGVNGKIGLFAGVGYRF